MRKLLLCCALTASIEAQMIDVSNYGWLDQYSMNNFFNGFVGDEACIPTASINGLTYLQNAVPSVFGIIFTGSSYTDWEQADCTLIGLMDTKPQIGTYNGPFVYGLIDYVNVLTGFPKVQFSGVFSPGKYPTTNTITAAIPTITDLSTAIGAGSAVLIEITYLNGNGGHELVVNGLDWNSETKTGTLYFVDSLDPSQNYSSSNPSAVLGPVKQTVGELSIHDGKLLLSYNQYQGTLSPYDPSNYGVFPATIQTLLAVGGAPYTPFANLLPNGNLHSIAQGFDAIDPTTAPMFNVLSVLNTADNLSAIFEQLDPSMYNSILFTEQTLSEQLLTLITNNLLQYRHPCTVSCDDSVLTGWCAPIATGVKQRAVSGGTYKNTILGTLIGFDYFFKRDFLIGSGFSYANSDVRWVSAQAKANMNNYGAFLYGAWFGDPLWIDLSTTYSYSRVDVRKCVTGLSSFPHIAPLNAQITQRINANILAGHLGMIYDLFWTKGFNLWPFFNFDAIFAHQPTYGQQGGGALDLTIMSKWNTLLRPEAGLGCSYYSCIRSDIDTFIHATLSYAYESHVGGSGTGAYFTAAGENNFFTVVGQVPVNHLLCPSIQAGIKAPGDTFRISVNYRGAFGSRLIANQFSAELNTLF